MTGIIAFDFFRISMRSNLRALKTIQIFLFIKSSIVDVEESLLKFLANNATNNSFKILRIFFCSNWNNKLIDMT